jgi:hypothetical protein
MASTYYYLLMSQQDLFENQVLEELLRERTNSYHIQNKLIDFWIMTNPEFINNSEILKKLETTNFFKQKKTNLIGYDEKSPFYGAIISSNKDFITWISLRLGYFENIENFKESDSNYFSTGILGKIEANNKKENNILNFKFSSNSLHPSFLVKKYQNLLKSFQLIN